MRKQIIIQQNGSISNNQTKYTAGLRGLVKHADNIAGMKSNISFVILK